MVRRPAGAPVIGTGAVRQAPPGAPPPGRRAWHAVCLYTDMNTDRRTGWKLARGGAGCATEEC